NLSAAAAIHSGCGAFNYYIIFGSVAVAATWYIAECPHLIRLCVERCLIQQQRLVCLWHQTDKRSWQRCRMHHRFERYFKRWIARYGRAVGCQSMVAVVVAIMHMDMMFDMLECLLLQKPANKTFNITWYAPDGGCLPKLSALKLKAVMSLSIKCVASSTDDKPINPPANDSNKVTPDPEVRLSLIAILDDTSLDDSTVKDARMNQQKKTLVA
ncbi:hypothetical protein THASP1DRAFT_26985, partial [Thamnocephalis sphaerospora]